MEYLADITITGNIICPYCQQWTGENINALIRETQHVKCQSCGKIVRIK